MRSRNIDELDTIKKYIYIYIDRAENAGVRNIPLNHRMMPPPTTVARWFLIHPAAKKMASLMPVLGGHSTDDSRDLPPEDALERLFLGPSSEEFRL